MFSLSNGMIKDIHEASTMYEISIIAITGMDIVLTRRRRRPSSWLQLIHAYRPDTDEPVRGTIAYFDDGGVGDPRLSSAAETRVRDGSVLLEPRSGVVRSA